MPLFRLACFSLHPARYNKCVEVHSMQEVWVTGQTNPKHHELWSAKENRLGHEFSFCLSLLTFCRWQCYFYSGPTLLPSRDIPQCSKVLLQSLENWPVPSCAVQLSSYTNAPRFSSVVVFTSDHSKLTILSLFACTFFNWNRIQNSLRRWID